MFTPLLAEMALKFGAFEFFWLGMVGVMMSGSLTGEHPLKGWLMGLLGLFVAHHRARPDPRPSRASPSARTR